MNDITHEIIEILDGQGESYGVFTIQEMIEHVQKLATRNEQRKLPEEVREQLAAVQHEIWSNWMKYLFSKCGVSEMNSCVPMYNGVAMTIPPGMVEHWKRQMTTPYAELTEKERESDRHQADKVIAIVG